MRAFFMLGPPVLSAWELNFENNPIILVFENKSIILNVNLSK